MTGPGGGQQFGQSVPAIASRSEWPGSSVHVVASSSIDDVEPLAGHERRRRRADDAGRVGRPAAAVA